MRLSGFLALGAVMVLVTGGFAACATKRTSFDREYPPGWERVFPSFAAQVYDLLRDTGDPRLIYAACGWQTTGTTSPVGGVLRSTDGGRSWAVSNRGIPPHADVLALAWAPHRFLGTLSSEALLAGTRSAGIYASTDGGASWHQLGSGDGTPDWDRLTLRSLVALPGDPPAVAASTDTHGVLVSTDSGTSWRTRNNGLLHLNIQALTLSTDGALLAGTWYGGLYETRTRGLDWSPLAPDLERSSISAVAEGADATIWVGFQNAGLVARPPGGTAFEPQGAAALEGTGILTIHAEGDEVVVGTSGRGVFIGRYGGEFVEIGQGLDNPTVSAVLVDPEGPGAILLGTWSGLYRAAASASRVESTVLTALIAVLVFSMGCVVAYRSAPAQAALLYYKLRRQDPKQLHVFLATAMALLALSGKSSRRVLELLARRLARDKSQASVAEVLLATAPLLGMLDARGKADTAQLRAMADALDHRIEALERWERDTLPEGEPHDAAAATRLTLRDRIFATLLRAESPGHLAVVVDELAQLEELARRHPEGPFLHPRFLGDLRGILEGLAPLQRLPSAEDRALFFGQSLTQTMKAQERLAVLSEKEPALGLVFGGMVLESIRQILATALQDLRQRADLVFELRSKVLTARREAVVMLEIRNVGQGHAQNVVVRLDTAAEALDVLQPRQHLHSLLRRQSACLEFLVEPRVSDRVRLTFQITWDDLEGRGHRREFADVVELRQAVETPFVPLYPNPYVVGRPLLESDLFIGREELFERLVSNLRGAHQDNVLVLTGQRRMGKTSILRRLDRHLPDDYVPVLVDLQGLFGSGEPAFFREVAATICDGLAERGVPIEEPPAAAFETDPGSLFRRRFLKDVRSALGRRRLLLLFDELEVLEERIGAGELTPQVLPYFRSLMQHESLVSFLFAGTHRLDELTSDYWGVLFNLAVYLEVGHLSESEVEELFTRPTAGRFEIDPLALSKVYHFASGHPHFSQLLARELVDFRNRRRLSYLTVQDVNKVAGVVADKGQLHITYLWDEATRDEQLLLLALQRLLRREGLATLEAVHLHLAERRVETGDLATAAHGLVRRGILTDEGGQLVFRMGLLRLWMDRYHDLESFLLSDDSTGDRARIRSRGKR